jgi:putative membrane protein
VRIRRLQVAASAVTVAGMLATPLTPRGGVGRRMLSSGVVGGLFSVTLASATRRWGARRTVAAAAVTTTATAAIERAGTVTGRPFGRYSYTSALQPQIADVPVLVPLAWFAMAVPAREVAHAALGPRSTPYTRIVCGAGALTAWDLFLDPQMVAEGYWRWARPGAYRGIPLSNFVGWFLTALAVMAVFEAALPPGEPDPELVAEYAVMATMETVAFASFFGDRVVAVAGALAMLPIAAAAVVRLRGRAW